MDRYQLIITLLGEEERANAEYVTGNMDRDSWAKAVREVDDKLSVLGVRLAFRPPEGMTVTAKF